jgi:ABC-type uncharacterized transport system YnjBCD ATPase subunit
MEKLRKVLNSPNHKFLQIPFPLIHQVTGYIMKQRISAFNRNILENKLHTYIAKVPQTLRKPQLARLCLVRICCRPPRVPLTQKYFSDRPKYKLIT